MLCCTNKKINKHRFKLCHIEKQTREDEFKPRHIVLDLQLFENFQNDELYLERILNELKQNSSIGRMYETKKYIELKKSFKDKVFQIEQQLISNNQNYEEYPSDYTMCLIANHVYCFKDNFKASKLTEISGFHTNSSKKTHSNKFLFKKCSPPIYKNDKLHTNFVWKQLHEQNWIIYDVLKLTGYKSILYLNEKTKQLVLAFQGFKFKSIDYLYSSSSKVYVQSLDKLLLNHLLALVYHLKISIQLSNKLNYSLSFTGYSFGSFFADLSVYFSHRYFDKPQVRAVTFESIGSFNLLNRINSSTINLSQLNIKSYLYETNLVNSFEKHLGKLIYIPARYSTLEKTTSLKPATDTLSLDEAKSLNSLGLKCLLLSFTNAVKTYEINNRISQLLNEHILFNQTKSELNQEIAELIQDQNLLADIPFAFVRNYLLNVIFQIFQVKKDISGKVNSYSLIEVATRSKLLDLDWNCFDKQLFIIKSISKYSSLDNLLLKQLESIKDSFKIDLASNSIKLSTNEQTNVQSLYNKLERLNQIYSNLDELIQNNENNLFVYQYVLREKEKFSNLVCDSNYVPINLELISEQITLIKSEPGTGKLTYCIRYAETRLKHESNLVVKLIDAKSSFSLLHDLYHFAKQLRLGPYGSVHLVKQIKNELNYLNMINFLLIFKNTERFELISEFFSGFEKNVQMILISENDSEMLNDYEIKRLSLDSFSLENYAQLGRKFQLDTQDVSLILDGIADKNVYKLKSLFNTLANCYETDLKLETIQKYYNQKFEIIKFNNLSTREITKNFSRLEFLKKNNRLTLDLVKYLSHLDGDYLNEELVKLVFFTIEPTGKNEDFEYAMHGLKKYSILSHCKMHRLVQKDALEYFRLNQNEKVSISNLISAVFSLVLNEANKQIVFKQIFSLMSSTLVKNYLCYMELNLASIETRLKSIDENLFEILKPEFEKFRKNLLQQKSSDQLPKEEGSLVNTFSEDYKYVIRDFLLIKLISFTSQKVLVHGEPGCGKTAVCLKYAHLRSNNESNFIARLIDASTSEILEYDLHKLACSLHVSNNSSSTNAIREKFEELKSKTFLLIIDNLVLNETILSRISDLVYNLSANVRVIITTRNPYVQFKLYGFTSMNFFYNHEDYTKLFANYSHALQKTFQSTNPNSYLVFIYECKLEKEDKPRGILKTKAFLNTLANNLDWTKNDLKNFYKDSANKYNYLRKQNQKAYEIFKYITVLNPSHLSNSLLMNLYELLYKSTAEFNETIELLVKMSLLYKISDERYMTYDFIQNELKTDYEFRLEAKNLFVDVLIKILDDENYSEYDVEVCFKQAYEIFKTRVESRFNEDSHVYFEKFKQPVTEKYFQLLDKLAKIDPTLIKCVKLLDLSDAERKAYISDSLNQDANIYELLTNSFLLIKSELDKAVELLENAEVILYEHFSELKRELQLSKETNALELKQINGIDVNVELEDLPVHLSKEVRELENEYEQLFDSLETYEKECNEVFLAKRELYLEKCQAYMKNLDYLKENWHELELAEMCAKVPKNLNISVAADIFYYEIEQEITQKINLTMFFKGKPVLLKSNKRMNSFRINFEKTSLIRRDSKKYPLKQLLDYVIDYFKKT